MKSRIVIAIMVLASLIEVQTAYAFNFLGLAKAFGFKEDSTVGALAKTADNLGNAVVAKKVNDTMNKYGSEQVDSYNTWASQYNDNKDREVQKYLSDVDKFKMDYCKSHGFYDQWYSRYGNEWFDREGRNWFDQQDELSERRTGERILPWHLRDASGVIDRANNSKVDGSLTNVVLGAIGLSDADARRAEEWNSSDKYGKRDILIDHSFNIIETATDNKGMVDAFRKLTKANNHYLRDKSNPETSAVAMSNMNLDLANIIYDTYEQGVDNRKAYLAEKLQIRNKLEEQGFDPSYSKEVAGTILSIQNSKDLSEPEKKEWLRLLGFYGDEERVLKTSQAISQMSESQAKNILDNVSAKEQTAEKERLEYEDQMRKNRERNEAIMSINSVVIDSYLIDESDLNEQQKEVIANIFEVLNNHHDLNIEIIGHTCDLGNDTVNEKIGLKRAEKVKEYLIDLGVDENRLSVSTFGENEPGVENNSAQNRLKNRRVSFTAK